MFKRNVKNYNKYLYSAFLENNSKKKVTQCAVLGNYVIFNSQESICIKYGTTLSSEQS